MADFFNYATFSLAMPFLFVVFDLMVLRKLCLSAFFFASLVNLLLCLFLNSFVFFFSRVSYFESVLE